MPRGSATSAPRMPVHDRLKARQRAERDGWPTDLALRVHRAISWLGRGEQAHDDPDLRFILLWIAFNAAYADEIRDEEDSERDRFRAYFDRLLRLDSVGQVFSAVWTRFPGEIRLLLENRHVFAPFWKFHNGRGNLDWHVQLERERGRVHEALARKDTGAILATLFDRLYVLRNQLVHGGATWASSVNRAQVKDGGSILFHLLPLFIELMMDHPREDWGRPYYPVVPA